MELWELAAREQVRHTISSYTFGGDRGRLDELAAAFTPHGVLQIEEDDVSTGRDAIIERLSRVVAMDRHPGHMHHHISGTHFRSVTPSGIDVSSYFLVITDIGADHWGRYRDRFVPVEDRWLIGHRRVTTDGYAAASAFRPDA
ncbi:MAG TPA: nuclear transport factor 2 family protein [Acidimicrobiia bacterium]